MTMNKSKRSRENPIHIYYGLDHNISSEFLTIPNEFIHQLSETHNTQCLFSQ